MKLFFLVLMSTALLISAANGQRLKVGDTVPVRVFSDVRGQPLDLSAYTGQRVLLTFFRYVGCPVCNVRAHELMEQHKKLEAAGIRVIAIYQSSPELLLSFEDTEGIPFSVVADPDGVLYKQFAVRKSFFGLVGSMLKKDVRAKAKQGESLYAAGAPPKRDGALTRLPADFLISPDGKVLRAHYGKHIADHIPLQELLKP